MKLSKGILLAVEGIDGAGKTTQVRLLAERLTAAGYEVVQTKEPTDGPHGRELRRSAQEGRHTPERELELFVADRAEHVEQLIQPAIDSGKIVIVDRYYFSSIAYQGARGLDPEKVRRENERIAPVPDILVLVDTPVAVALDRIRHGRGDQPNLFERADLLEQAKAQFDRMDWDYLLRLDGTLSISDLHEAIYTRLETTVLRERLAAG